MKKIIYILILLLVCSSFSFADKTFEEKVKEHESKFTWKQTQKYQGAISEIKTLITMCDNFIIIDDVRKNKIIHEKLKTILDKFDDIIKHKGKSKDAFVEMYDYLASQMPDGKLTHGSVGILDVLDNGGDCNDFSPAFYSIFRYYGFEIYVITGQVFKKDDSDEPGLHAWVGVVLNKKLIELDPLWYGSYYELHRIYNENKWNIMNVKEKFHRNRWE